MKRIGPISCMCSALLLSSCTLTQQQAPLSTEDAAARQRAASELDLALQIEEKRLLEEARQEAEAREEAEERAREEAEEKARSAAEEAARKEQTKAKEKASKSEETGRKDTVPQLLNNRPRKDKQEESVTPSAEQQKKAMEMLSKQPQKAPAAKPEPKNAPAQSESPQEEMQLPGSVMNGGLRTRRFAPPEEAISRDDNDEPMPNTVELRGLRSPVMKGNLPMNIDGKMIKEN